MAKDIILVDKNDQEIGVGEKTEVHQSGKLHHAFFGSKKLLTRRWRSGLARHSPAPYGTGRRRVDKKLRGAKIG